MVQKEFAAFVAGLEEGIVVAAAEYMIASAGTGQEASVEPKEAISDRSASAVGQLEAATA